MKLCSIEGENDNERKTRGLIIMSNNEKQKALIESEIDGFAIRYVLSDAAKLAIKKICEFDKLGTSPVAMECDGYPLSLTSLINLMELSHIRRKDCKAICFYIPID